MEGRVATRVVSSEFPGEAEAESPGLMMNLNDQSREAIPDERRRQGWRVEGFNNFRLVQAEWNEESMHEPVEHVYKRD